MPEAGRTTRQSGDRGLSEDPLDDDPPAAPLPSESASGRQFRELYSELLPELGAFFSARAMSNEADDLVHEVLLITWRRWNDLPLAHTDRRAWVYETAKKVLARHRRDKARDRHLLEAVSLTATSAQHIAPQRDIVVQIWVTQLLSALPERHRTVIELVAIHECSTAEAATALGISQSALRTRLSRARRALISLRDAETMSNSGDHEYHDDHTPTTFWGGDGRFGPGTPPVRDTRSHRRSRARTTRPQVRRRGQRTDPPDPHRLGLKAHCRARRLATGLIYVQPRRAHSAGFTTHHRVIPCDRDRPRGGRGVTCRGVVTQITCNRRHGPLCGGM